MSIPAPPPVADAVPRGTTAPAPVVELVSSVEEMIALEAEWDALVERAGASVYSTFDWIRAWWKYFGRGNALHCLLFRSEGRLVAIAPLYRERVRVLGIPAATRLQFMGPPLSDYNDIIVEKGSEGAVIQALAGHLASARGTWDVFDLEDVSERSQVFAALPELFARAGFPVMAYQGNVCPVRELPGTWEELVLSIGPNLRSNLKRKQKKLNEAFHTELELVHDPGQDIEEAVGAFAAIHGGRWKALGYPSAFDDGDHLRFHTEIAMRFARKGWLKLFFLRVEGARVAVSFNFNFRDRIYMYQCNAFGPDEVMKYSPGMIIKALSMEHGIRTGMKVYDFLRGDEPYKYAEWKSVDSKNWLLRAPSPFPESRLRLRLFLAREFTVKSLGRIRREYYEFRRFVATKRPPMDGAWDFALGRIRILFGLGIGYFRRNRVASRTGRDGRQGGGKEA